VGGISKGREPDKNYSLGMLGFFWGRKPVDENGQVDGFFHVLYGFVMFSIA
jgi:hypothetical protein